MPDLSQDLRTYIDELSRQAELRLDDLPVDSPASSPDLPRRRARSSVLVPFVIGLLLVVAISGAVAVSRRTANSSLDVGGSTTSVAPSGPEGRIAASVEPASGLLDGGSVTVHATGFTPGQMVAVVMCTGDVTDPAGGSAACDFETLSQAPAGPEGVLDLAYRVRRLIRVNGAFDCGTEPTGCRIAVGPAIQGPGGTVGDSVAIAFAPGPAAPLPTISMSPSTALRDAQTVMITGANFAPDTDVRVIECPPNTDCGYEPFGVTAHTDAVGRFRQPLTLHRTFLVPANLGNGPTTQDLDCTSGCTINAVQSGPASNLSAEPLPFTLVG